jgi:diacylglycerol kinase family enzyme
MRLLWLFRKLFTGSHIRHRLASRAAVTKITLDLEKPVNVIIDGEVMKLQIRSVDILPSALDVIV